MARTETDHGRIGVADPATQASPEAATASSPSGECPLRGETPYKAAKREALGLASSLHRRHYFHVKQWKPLDDAAGIISQIDNMTAGLGLRIDELSDVLQQFVNGVETHMIDSPADDILANITNRARKALAEVRGEQVSS